MKTKKIFAFLLAFALVLGLAGCVTTEPTTQGPEKQSVSEVLAAPQNNTEVYVEGTVFAVAPHGYYISDGTQGIFVSLGSAATPTCTVGQKLEVKAKLSYVSKFPQLINVTSEEAVGTDTEISATEKEIAAINALDKDAVASYACYFLVTGTLAKDEAGTYYLSDDEGNKLFFDASTSATTVLETKISYRVQLPVVTYKNTASWLVSFCGTEQSIADKTRTAADYEPFVAQDLDNRVAKEIYGAISLPSAHKTFTFLKYTWSVKEETTWITFENNVPTVNYNEEDHNLTLVCSFQVGEQTGTVEYPIVSKAIVERSVKELLDNQPAVNLSVVKVRGIVSALAHNQSRSLYSIVIQDKTEPSKNGVFIEFSSTLTDQQKFAVGDEVVFEGYYRNLLSNDRPCILTMKDADGKLDKYEIVSHNNSVNTNAALVVDSQEKYNELAANYFDYIGRIVTFVNPYANMNKATVTTSTYIDLGHNEATRQYAMASGQTLTFGFVLMGSSDENFGSDLWYTYFGIGSTSAQSGMTVSCIPGYYEAGGHSQLIVVNSESVKPSDETKVVDFKIKAAVEKNSKTQFTLPATVGDVAITWASSNTEVVANDGKVNPLLQEDTNVVLTASYKLTAEGETLTSQVNVVAQADKTYTISELIASAQSGVTYKVTGVVVGFMGGNTASSTDAFPILSDGKNFAVLSALKDGARGVKLESTVIEIGHEFTLTNVSYAGGRISASADTEFILSANKVDITAANWFAPEGVTTVTSKEELSTAMNGEGSIAAATTDGWQVYKLSASGETYLYWGANAKNRAQFWFGGDADGTSANNDKITITAISETTGYHTFTHIWSFYNCGLGDFCLNKLRYPANLTEGDIAITSTSASNPAAATQGDVYVVYYRAGSTGTPTAYFGLIAAGFTLDTVITRADAEKQIKDGIPSSIEATVTDLTGWTFCEVGTLFKEISYAVSGTAINLETQAITHGTENATVTVTVTYKLQKDTEEHIVTKDVTVKGAAEKIYTVAELAALTADCASIKVEGVVAAFGQNGSSTLKTGIVLMDSTGVSVLLTGLTGTYPVYKDSADVQIKVGDYLVVSGDYKVAYTSEQTGKAVATENAKVTINNESTKKYTLSLTSVASTMITVSNDAELTALMARTDIPFGTVIKISGPVYVRRSAKVTADCNFIFHYKSAATALDGVKYPVKGTTTKEALVVKAATGSYIASDWYTTQFVGIPASGSSVQTPGTLFNGNVYIIITHDTGTYYQATIFDIASWNLSK